VYLVGFYYNNFRNLYKLLLLYVIDIHNGATTDLGTSKRRTYHWQLVLKSGISCSLKMVHLYRIMSEITPVKFLYTQYCAFGCCN